MKSTGIAFILFAAWVFFSLSITMLLSMCSPHGMAMFIYCSAILGVLGGLAQNFVFFGRYTVHEKNTYGVYAGIFCGVISFPVATFLNERRILLPSDMYQILVMIYLCMLGASLGHFISKFANKKLWRS